MENVFALVDGIDLSGKTSATTSLGLMGYLVKKSLINGINPLKENVRHLRADGLEDKDIILDLYTVALEYKIENFVVPTQNTVLDSSLLLRTLAYHTIAGNDVSRIQKLGFIHPKFTSANILTVNPEQRLKRLQERREQGLSVQQIDILIEKDPERVENMDKAIIEYGKLYFNANIIDTTHLRKEEVLAKLINYIEP